MKTENKIEILLVEDNPHDAELTMRVLKKNNLSDHILWLKDGTEALDYFFGTGRDAPETIDYAPKMILLDLKLPKTDGLDVLRRLKSDRRTDMIPVVMLTSSREDQDIAQSYRLGVNSYIVKPVDFENFSEAVAQLGKYWLLLNQRVEDSAPSKNSEWMP